MTRLSIPLRRERREVLVDKGKALVGQLEAVECLEPRDLATRQPLPRTETANAARQVVERAGAKDDVQVLVRVRADHCVL
jgi:hypothetical protein